MAKVAAEKTPDAPDSPVLPTVGQIVVYRPNDRETYAGTVTAVNPDFSVKLVFTNPAGCDQTVTVPHKSRAEQITYGPHWLANPE